MVEVAVLTAEGAAGLMEAEVASMEAAAHTVAEDFRGEEALLAAAVLAGGVPQDRASVADRSVERNAVGRSAERHAVGRSAERNAVDNRAGHRRVVPVRSARVPAILRRWAAGARAASAAAGEATLGLRAMRAMELLMERGIRSAAGVAVLAPPQIRADFTRPI
jgi:hypothetical protein